MKAIKDDIQKLTDEYVKALVDHGTAVAKHYYENAVYAGDNDSVVTSEGNEVMATGEAAMFIEFGTGVLRKSAPAEAYALVEQSDGLVNHGQYGERRAMNIWGWDFYSLGNLIGKQPPDDYFKTLRDRHGTIKYGFRHTWGNDATPGIYFARKDVIEKMEDIAKKVFK